MWIFLGPLTGIPALAAARGAEMAYGAAERLSEAELYEASSAVSRVAPALKPEHSHARASFAELESILGRGPTDLRGDFYEPYLKGSP